MVSLLQRVPFSNAGVPAQQKGTKRLCPGVRPARWGSGYLRYGTDPGAAAPVCFAAPPSAVYDCVVRSLRSHPRIDPFTQPAEGAKDQKPEQKPLTLALSRRERGLTEVFRRNTPTCDIESNADSEKPANRLPLPRERAGVRGESDTDPKQTTRFSPLKTMSASSSTAFDLDPPATSEG